MKNFYDFVNKLKTAPPNNCKMTPLNVKSLLTNIPVQDAIYCLGRRLQ